MEVIDPSDYLSRLFPFYLRHPIAVVVVGEGGWRWFGASGKTRRRKRQKEELEVTRSHERFLP